jgi:hypothetical protein
MMNDEFYRVLGAQAFGMFIAFAGAWIHRQLGSEKAQVVGKVLSDIPATGNIFTDEAVKGISQALLSATAPVSPAASDPVPAVEEPSSAPVAVVQNAG